MAKRTKRTTAKLPGLDPVLGQYEQWVYPEPILDLSDPGLSGAYDSGDPYMLGPAYWPDRPLRRDLRILVAGCGANAAARYAFHNPDAHVVGVDISAASLAHSEFLKQKHRLQNLSLHRCAINRIAALGEKFELIDCTGVLHHVADPVSDLAALTEALHRDGVIYLMLYGKYGRAGVYMLQQLFRILSIGLEPSDVALVKQTLSALGPDHPVHPYIPRASDLRFDTGIVDTFLHARDRAYTVKDCLRFLDSAGLTLQGWHDNALYYPEAQIPREHPLFAKISALAEEDIWEAMELFYGRIAKHSLYACHKNRDPSTYRIPFEGETFIDMVPIKRPDLSIDSSLDGSVTYERPSSPKKTLVNTQAAIARQIDNRKTIWECFSAANIASPSRSASVSYCRNMFRDLWKFGYLHFVFRSAFSD